MRSFFALPLPGSIRRRLAELKTDRLSSRRGKVRWVPEHQLHLTLRFVGEIDEERARQLVEAVQARRQAEPWPAPRLQVRGLGTFGRPRRARVLWAAVEPLEPLAKIAAALEDAVQSVGLPAERRPFAAHITLARLDRPDPAAVEALLEQHLAYQTAPFEVPEVILYRSTLGPKGSVHDPIERFGL